MQAVLDAQRAAFMAELPVPIAIRKDRLKRCVALLVDNSDALCNALSDDFGHRSREQSQITDIVASIRALKHAIAHVDRWARPERRKLDFPLGLLGARAHVEYQPKGVVGVISPWNFPVQLTMGPIGGAFAAGNRVMVKSSEYTPGVAALLEEIAPRYFDATELAFFSGGPEVGKAFSALPFDHLIFTGATAVGRHILHAAADNLTPVTLELGGKSPTIIGRGANIAQPPNASRWARCSMPDRSASRRIICSCRRRMRRRWWRASRPPRRPSIPRCSPIRTIHRW